LKQGRRVTMTPDQKREMKREWESWESILLDDLIRFEKRLQIIYGRMATFGVKGTEAEPYVKEQLIDLVKRSTEVLDMLEVNMNEYKVIQQVEAGNQRGQDMDINMSKANISHYLSTLTKRGILERVDRGTYKRSEKEIIPVSVKSSNPDRVVKKDIVIDTKIDPDKQFYLQQHYGKVPRKQLAKKLGIGKLELNQIIIEGVVKV
jgi:DNA-binding transcriptional ArsR family regulator